MNQSEQGNLQQGTERHSISKSLEEINQQMAQIQQDHEYDSDPQSDEEEDSQDLQSQNPIPSEEEQDKFYREIQKMMEIIEKDQKKGGFLNGDVVQLSPRKFRIIEHWINEGTQQQKPQLKARKVDNNKRRDLRFRGRQIFSHLNTSRILWSNEQTYELKEVRFKLVLTNLINEEYAVLKMNHRIKQLVGEHTNKIIRILIGLQDYNRIPREVLKVYQELKDQNPSQSRDYYMKI